MTIYRHKESGTMFGSVQRVREYAITYAERTHGQSYSVQHIDTAKRVPSGWIYTPYGCVTTHHGQYIWHAPVKEDTRVIGRDGRVTRKLTRAEMRNLL